MARGMLYRLTIPLIISVAAPSATIAFPVGPFTASSAAAAPAAAGPAATASASTYSFSTGRKVSFGRSLQQQQQQLHPRNLSRANTRGGRVAMAMSNSGIVQKVGLFTAGMVLGCLASTPIKSNFHLYRTVPDIPKSMFDKHATMSATVVSVSDGDSIRVRHKPNVPLPLPGRSMEGKKRSEETLQIRLYGVDCPEVAHFGNPAQAFSAEAKELTKNALQDKNVKLTLLSTDQYNRAVCRVQYGKPPFRKDASAELLKNGLAVMYRQGGAEYDGREKALSDMEEEAKKNKVGLWGRKGGETPAQYKARVKREKAASA